MCIQWEKKKDFINCVSYRYNSMETTPSPADDSRYSQDR